MTAVKGFGTLSAADVLIGEIPLGQLVPIVNASPNPPGKVQNVSSAVTNIILGRTIDGASTVIIQLQDSTRSILRSGIFDFGLTLTLDGLNFALVAFTKAGDQLQLTFESAAVYNLRQQKGAMNWPSTSDLSGFAQHLISATPGATLVCQPGPVSFATGAGSLASSTETSIARGTTANPTEDSWTCLNRLFNSAGWRIFECEGQITAGSDSWLLTESPSAGTIEEFTTAVQVIDGSYDIGMPLGQLTVAAMNEKWEAKPGQPITAANMGPFSGVWLVYALQRNNFNPQGSMTLQTPMTPEQVRVGVPTLQNV